METYYTVLGIPETATEEDIKRAYRKIALKFHPDKHPGTNETFRKATDAYNILQNSVTRRQYDQELRPVKSGRSGPARSRRGLDIRAIVKLTAEDVAGEVTKDLLITRQVHCAFCEGTGSSTGRNIICQSCNGSGIDLVSSVMGPQKFCALCRGYGSVPENDSCSACHGRGLAAEQRIEHVSTRNFSPVCTIKGSGNYLRGGGTAGDLIISFELEKSSTFKVDGKNIRGIVKISPAQAVLGDVIFVDVFGSVEKVEIPPRTRPGIIIEKKNAGASRGKARGSLFLKIFFDIPQKLSEEEENLYRQLRSLQNTGRRK